MLFLFYPSIHCNQVLVGLCVWFDFLDVLFNLNLSYLYSSQFLPSLFYLYRLGTLKTDVQLNIIIQFLVWHNLLLCVWIDLLGMLFNLNFSHLCIPFNSSTCLFYLYRRGTQNYASRFSIIIFFSYMFLNLGQRKGITRWESKPHQQGESLCSQLTELLKFSI